MKIKKGEMEMKKKTFKKFSKEEKKGYIEEKKNELKNMIKDFFLCKEDIQKLSKRYHLLSDEKFYNYSLLNSILILKQNAFICLSFNKWKEKERSVIKGAKAVKIYVPVLSKIYTCKDCCKKIFFTKADAEKHNNINNFKIEESLSFNIGNVFDISSTEGKDLNFKYEENTENNITFDYKIIKDILSNEFNFKVNEIISKSRGHVLSNNHNNIYISSISNNTDKIKTLIHELAHLILHIRTGKTTDMQKEVKEVEAEAVAYIIESFLNIDIRFSELYIKSFSNKEIINKIDFNSICKLSEKLLNILNKFLTKLSNIA